MPIALNTMLDSCVRLTPSGGIRVPRRMLRWIMCVLDVLGQASTLACEHQVLYFPIAVPVDVRRGSVRVCFVFVHWASQYHS